MFYEPEPLRVSPDAPMEPAPMANREPTRPLQTSKPQPTYATSTESQTEKPKSPPKPPTPTGRPQPLPRERQVLPKPELILAPDRTSTESTLTVAHESFPVGQHVSKSEMVTWQIVSLIAGVLAVVFLILFILSDDHSQSRRGELDKIYQANPKLKEQFHK